MPSWSTTNSFPGKLAAVLCVAPLLLTACGADATLLNTDDLPEVSETSDGSQGAPGVGWCDALGYLETGKLSAAANGTTGEQYVLKNGDVVGATVFVPGGGDFPDAGSMLTAIDEAANDCSTEASQGDHGEATSEPIKGLPDGAVGFTFMNTSSSPVEIGRIAFAESEDGRLVAVGVTHTGNGTASVDISDLLSDALDRAADVHGTD